MHRLYKTATKLAGIFLPYYLIRRMRAGKESGRSLAEKLGHISLSRPEGKLCWLHAASVGEAVSIQKLLGLLQIRYPQWHFLLTTGTLTSAKLMAERLPSTVMHQFAPLDTPKILTRFLRHWQPQAAIWVESELWPNQILLLGQSACKLGLVNARMSARSLAAGSVFKPY